MSIWKDLLFLGGYVATPTGLAATAPEAIVELAPVRQVAAKPPVKPPIRPNRVSPSELLW